MPPARSRCHQTISIWPPAASPETFMAHRIVRSLLTKRVTSGPTRLRVRRLDTPTRLINFWETMRVSWSSTDFGESGLPGPLQPAVLLSIGKRLLLLGLLACVACCASGPRTRPSPAAQAGFCGALRGLSTHAAGGQWVVRVCQAA